MNRLTPRRSCGRGCAAVNWKDRRQFPVGQFIADFCCQQRRLIIELNYQAALLAAEICYELADRELPPILPVDRCAAAPTASPRRQSVHAEDCARSCGIRRG